MPIDNYTKDFFKDTKTVLHNILGRLDQLVAASSKPQENGVDRKRRYDYPNEERGPTVGNRLSPSREKPSLNGGNGSEAAWEKLVKRYKPAIELAGIFSAIIYAWITFHQWQDARDNFQISQRPWVGVVTPGKTNQETFFDPIEAGKPYRWHYMLKNYGVSPALCARSHARTYVQRGVQSIRWDQIRNDIESLPLYDNSEYPLFGGDEAPDSGASNEPLDGPTVQEVNAAKSYVILGGRIKYFDNLNVEHTTTWCVIYIPPVEGMYPGWHTCPFAAIAD